MKSTFRNKVYAAWVATTLRWLLLRKLERQFDKDKHRDWLAATEAWFKLPLVGSGDRLFQPVHGIKGPDDLHSADCAVCIHNAPREASRPPKR